MSLTGNLPAGYDILNSVASEAFCFLEHWYSISFAPVSREVPSLQFYTKKIVGV
jgi:hypothetical protein